MKRSVAVAVLVGLTLFALPVVAQDENQPFRRSEEIKSLCDKLDILLADLQKRYPANHPRIWVARERLTDLQKSYPCICFPQTVVLEAPVPCRRQLDAKLQNLLDSTGDKPSEHRGSR